MILLVALELHSHLQLCSRIERHLSGRFTYLHLNIIYKHYYDMILDDKWKIIFFVKFQNTGGENLYIEPKSKLI